MRIIAASLEQLVGQVSEADLEHARGVKAGALGTANSGRKGSDDYEAGVRQGRALAELGDAFPGFPATAGLIAQGINASLRPSVRQALTDGALVGVATS
ncbi:MAG: hypothetical protein AAFY60_03150 [Myxococcota bacterium]